MLIVSEVDADRDLLKYKPSHRSDKTCACLKKRRIEVRVRTNLIKKKTKKRLIIVLVKRANMDIMTDRQMDK